MQLQVLGNQVNGLISLPAASPEHAAEQEHPLGDNFFSPAI
jgi:hypothetical protein